MTDPLPSGRAIEYIRSSANYQIHELSGSRVQASLSLNEAHHQPFGRVHGASTPLRSKASPVPVPAQLICARIYCSASMASAISASAAMIAKPRARKMLPADATTLVVPTTGAIPIMIA